MGRNVDHLHGSPSVCTSSSAFFPPPPPFYPLSFYLSSTPQRGAAPHTNRDAGGEKGGGWVGRVLPEEGGREDTKGGWPTNGGDRRTPRMKIIASVAKLQRKNIVLELEGADSLTLSNGRRN